MAETGVPHFHNDVGVPAIDVGSKEFMCIGARPPFDHPHIFIDMGDENDAVCGYCALGPGRADPAACLWDRRGAAA
jgi:uncharacterized Zn-finger protein